MKEVWVCGHYGDGPFFVAESEENAIEVVDREVKSQWGEAWGEGKADYWIKKVPSE